MQHLLEFLYHQHGLQVCKRNTTSLMVKGLAPSGSHKITCQSLMMLIQSTTINFWCNHTRNFWNWNILLWHCIWVACSLLLSMSLTHGGHGSGIVGDGHRGISSKAARTSSLVSTNSNKSGWSCVRNTECMPPVLQVLQVKYSSAFGFTSSTSHTNIYDWKFTGNSCRLVPLDAFFSCTGGVPLSRSSLRIFLPMNAN